MGQVKVVESNKLKENRKFFEKLTIGDAFLCEIHGFCIKSSNDKAFVFQKGIITFLPGWGVIPCSAVLEYTID